jgi:hypothetical protein
MHTFALLCTLQRWVSGATRKGVALLADTFYVTVAFQLARVRNCLF